MACFTFLVSVFLLWIPDTGMAVKLSPQSRGFYTDSICGAVLSESCNLGQPRIVCGQDSCAQLAPYHGVLHIHRGHQHTHTGRDTPRIVDTSSHGYKENRLQPFCGATLISEQWVITAAHCVHSNKKGDSYCVTPEIGAELCRDSCPQGCHRVHPSQLKVTFGMTDMMRKDSGQTMGVQTIVIHPGWNILSQDNDIRNGHDISLLRLSGKVVLSPSVWPVCLPDPVLAQRLTQEGAEVSVVGFGITNTTTKAEADILQSASVTVVSPGSCQSPSSSSFLWKFQGDQICAQGKILWESSRPCFRDSCQGDSGGGLISNNFGRRFLVGVVSFGEMSCGSVYTPRPGVYTNMGSHTHWVSDVREHIENVHLGWGSWSGWSTCSVTCGGGHRVRSRVCSHPVRTSQPLLGHFVGSQCQGHDLAVESCEEKDCTVKLPGVELIEEIPSIIGGLVDSANPKPSSTPSPKPSPAPSPVPSPGIRCTHSCKGWPHSQCSVTAHSENGSWQTASCLNPYRDTQGLFNIPFNPFVILGTNKKHKYTNYPECGVIPGNCERCDDYCARIDGKRDRFDYQ